MALFTVCVALLMQVQPAFSQSLSPVLVLSTVAGSGTATDTGDGGPALTAGMKAPYGVAVDKAGNIYIAEASSIVRKVSASGAISTVAGTSGSTGFSGDGGPATGALLGAIYSVAIDNNGNLLIADEGNQVIRRVDAVTGIITTIAGTPHSAGRSGDSGPATSALLNAPFGVSTDSAGNIYIADWGNHVVRKVDTSGTITTFAGNGTSGSTGDGGPATQAELKGPFRPWVDAAGNVYIADNSGQEIRMIDTNGIIHTVAGTGTVEAKGHLGDGGPATSGELSSPREAISDGLGNTYIADQADHIIRGVDANGVINTVAGTPNTNSASTPLGDGGPATAGTLYFPYDIAIDASNNLYIADNGNYRIRRLSLNTGLPTTAVGASATQNLFVQSSTAVTPSSSAITPSTGFVLGTLSGCSLGVQLAAKTPCSVPVTFQPTAPGMRMAQLAFTDASGNASVIGLRGIGIAPQAAFSLTAITTIAGNGTAGNAGAGSPAASAQVNAPRGGVIDSAGNIYFADSGNNVIRKIDAASDTLSTVAGNGTAGYNGDGAAATTAELNAPAKVVLDAAGNLYIADTGNNTIRFVDAATGIISTIAGNGTAGYTGDGGAATASELNAPQGLAVDLGGHVYVADTGNNVIRYFGKGGEISTFVGTGVSGYSGDGANAHGAALHGPESVVLDQSGDVYIADTGNDVVRVISSRNQISTFAGQQGNAANAGDGGPATAATLDHPSDIALDAAGDVYIAAGGQVRLVNSTGIISTFAGTVTSGSYSGEGGAATSAVLPAPIGNLMLNSGNVVLADTAGNRLLKVSTTTPMSLNFGVQAPGTTGQATTFSVLNYGNSVLNIGGITATAGFTLQTGGTSDCTAATSLAPGQSCSVGIVFSPTSTADGAVTGTLTLTDNTLNGTGTAQTFALSGSTRVLSDTTTVVSVTPVSPVYGASLILTAMVNNGNSATGTVNFIVNGASVGSQPVSNNQAAITLPGFPSGVIQIAANYSGDSNNSSSAGTDTVTIHPAVLTATAKNATIALGTTPPALTYTITGFVNGDSNSVVTGAPAEITTATPASPQGTYPITISQGTLAASNYTFTFVNGTLTVGPPPPPDFLLSITPSTISLPASQPSTVATLTLIPLYNYTGIVKISCTSVPQGLGCSDANLKGDGGPVTGNAQGNAVWTQVTISGAGKNSSSVAAYRAPARPRRQLWLAMGMPLCFFGLAICRSRKKWTGTLLGLILLPVLIVGVTSCAGNSAAPPTKGSYQVTVTATDSSAQLSHATTITLTFE